MHDASIRENEYWKEFKDLKNVFGNIVNDLLYREIWYNISFILFSDAQFIFMFWLDNYKCRKIVGVLDKDHFVIILELVEENYTRQEEALTLIEPLLNGNAREINESQFINYLIFTSPKKL